MTTATRNLLRWELCWVPVEIVMTGLGLFLLLGLEMAEAGTWFLFFAVAMSFTVRTVHYLSIRRVQGNNVP